MNYNPCVNCLRGVLERGLHHPTHWSSCTACSAHWASHAGPQCVLCVLYCAVCVLFASTLQWYRTLLTKSTGFKVLVAPASSAVPSNSGHAQYHPHITDGQFHVVTEARGPCRRFQLPCTFAPNRREVRDDTIAAAVDLLEQHHYRDWESGRMLTRTAARRDGGYSGHGDAHRPRRGTEPCHSSEGPLRALLLCGEAP